MSERGPGHLEGSASSGAVRMGTFLVPSPGDSEAGREFAITNNFGVTENEPAVLLLSICCICNLALLLFLGYTDVH